MNEYDELRERIVDAISDNVYEDPCCGGIMGVGDAADVIMNILQQKGILPSP